MRKYIIYNLLALLCIVSVFSSCSKEEETVKNNSIKRIFLTSLYSTTTGALVGNSTTIVTSVNGKNTLSCVEKDLNGNVINEYTIEDVSDFAVNLIGSWKSTSYTYTYDSDASKNGSKICDNQNYMEVLFTAKKVIQRIFKDGVLTSTNEFYYILEGNSLKMNISFQSISVSVDGDVLTITAKYDDLTEVQKYSRQ